MMKALVAYSSRTGNTKKVAEAIAAALADAELCPVSEMPEDLSPYGLVFFGFWAWSRGADPEARAALGKLSGKRVALFATAGAWPGEAAEKKYLAGAAALLPADAEVLGGFLCQGRVASYHAGLMGNAPEPAHPLTPERKARLEEAERHPDAEDLSRAAAFARAVAEAAEKE